MTPASEPPAPTVFSTAGLPAARRVELWESHNAAALIGLDVHAAEPLDATEVNVPLPRVHLARVTGSAHVVERTAGVIGRAPSDAVAVYLTLRGDAWFRHAGGTRALRPGSALLWDTDQPFARGFAQGLEELVVKVDRAALTARIGGTRPARPAGPVVTCFAAAGHDTSALARVGSDQYARALARLAGRATRATRADRTTQTDPARRADGPAPAPADESVILDLVAVLAAGRLAARATAHRAAACLYIEEHLTDPALGAGQVAAAIGLSERQLSRVFAADGTSLPRHILTRRLDLAYELLASAPPAGHGPAGRAVADVAARCGFTSPAYFSHAFRAYFGHRATDVRGSGHPHV